MVSWVDGSASLFNPALTVQSVPLGSDRYCHVIDDALADPDALVDWACSQTFGPPKEYAYPGVLCGVPTGITQRVADCFAQHVRSRMGVRRTLDPSVRLSLVTLAPEQLVPCQWQCHRDRSIGAQDDTLLVASVLYLFKDPALGGTSFYEPRQEPALTDRMVADSLALDAHAFAARYGLEPSYMTDSNAYFERVATVPAAWNRLIFYDGGLFHSGDIARPDLLSTDPSRGRLTLNGFFTCRRKAN
jgi:hypothetical protein